MVVILVFLTFAACILADWLIHGREVKKSRSAWVRPVEAVKQALSPPVYVGGFQMQPEMAFHPGHTWALPEGEDQVRVGIDDFAHKLAGKAETFGLPDMGTQVVQGKPAAVLSSKTKGKNVPLLSPVSGRVVAVNAMPLGPEKAQADPYGDGWLFVVQTRDLQTNLNNLLSGDLVRRWLEDASAHLRLRLGTVAGLSFPDGGTAVADLSALADEGAWSSLVREFLLTEPQTPSA